MNDPAVKKKIFVEQRRAQEEARRRQQNQHAAAEPSHITVQVAASASIHVSPTHTYQECPLSPSSSQVNQQEWLQSAGARIQEAG